jgi:hypothetical protein
MVNLNRASRSVIVLGQNFGLGASISVSRGIRMRAPADEPPGGRNRVYSGPGGGRGGHRLGDARPEWINRQNLPADVGFFFYSRG